MKEAIYILIGIGMIYGGLHFLRKNLHLQKNGIRTIAKVVSTRYVGTSNSTSDDNTRSTPMYSETIEYKTEKNETIVVELGDSSAAQTDIGTERKIIYDPQFPEKPMLNNTLTVVIAPSLFAAGGLFIVVWHVLQFAK